MVFQYDWFPFLILFYAFKTTILKRGPWKKKKKGIKVLKVTDKSSCEWWLQFSLNTHQMSFIPQWRNGTTEKVNIDEQKRRERSAAEDRAGGWQSSAPWKDRLQKEKTGGSVTTTNKQANDNSLLAASDFGLRDESTKTWVFVKNTDSQALDWAWGSVLLTSIPGDLGIKHK